MSLGLKQKQTAVDKLMEVASKSTAVIAADYKGLKSSEMTELRAKVRQLGSGTHLQVVRNTLAKRAFAGTNYEPLTNKLKGPVLLAFSKNETSSIARLLRDFAKEREKLSVTALFVDGTLFNGNQLELVANLPTKPEAITKLVIVMQAPVVKLVRTLAEPQAKLVRTIMAVCNTK
ncbi:MAG: 50S ribosomal protein L10 [Gammaproteobacteria bacterium]|jgi:large subunit ribosomal protein L10